MVSTVKIVIEKKIIKLLRLIGILYDMSSQAYVVIVYR
jgi:hypothetical protein